MLPNRPGAPATQCLETGTAYFDANTLLNVCDSTLLYEIFSDDRKIIVCARKGKEILLVVYFSKLYIHI